MTNDEKAKAYDEALEDMRVIYPNLKGDAKLAVEHAFPQLRESNEEEIRKDIIGGLMWQRDNLESEGPHDNNLILPGFCLTVGKHLSYLEKQEQKELPLMDGNADLYFDEWNQQKQNPTKRQCFEEGIRYAQRLQQEQKPNSTEDMPYITDERFFERKPKDSFKYKLAEYMTKCCTKKESPYGYSYSINSESILQMAKEELIKRGELKEQKPVMIQWTGRNLKEVIDFTGKSPKFGEWFKSWDEFEEYVHSHNDILKLFCEDGSHYEVPVGAWIVKTPDGYNIPSRFMFVQKPAEWSEEDEKIMDSIINELGQHYKTCTSRDCPSASFSFKAYQKEIDWLKSLRPSWKPNEEQMEALNYAIAEWDGGKKLEGLYALRADLKNL